MPHVFDHGSGRNVVVDDWSDGGSTTATQLTNIPTLHSEMVSAAGLAPAVSRAQTERVAPTLRTETPDD